MSKFNDTYNEFMLELLQDKYDKNVIIESFKDSGYTDFSLYLTEISLGKFSIGEPTEPRNVDEFISQFKNKSYDNAKAEYDFIHNPTNQSKVLSSAYIQKDGRYPKLALQDLLSKLEIAYQAKQLAYKGSASEYDKQPYLVKEPALIKK